MEKEICIIFSGPKRKNYRNPLIKIIQRFLGSETEIQSYFFLLHYNQLPKKSYKSPLVCNLVTAAVATIPVLWEKASPPVICDLITRVNDIRLMEDLTSLLRGTE